MDSIYRFMRKQGLVRPRSGRIVAGVCAGLGTAFGVDAGLVRLVFIASLLIPGSQAIVYLAGWFLMPEE